MRGYQIGVKRSLSEKKRDTLGAYRIPRRPAFSLENTDERQLVRRL
jgi:hypothetical protein